MEGHFELDVQIVRLSKNRWTWSIRRAGVVLTPLAEIRYKTSRDAERGAMMWREELWADLSMGIEIDEGCDKCWTETGVCVECGDRTVITTCETCGKHYCSMCFDEDLGMCTKCVEEDSCAICDNCVTANEVCAECTPKKEEAKCE